MLTSAYPQIWRPCSDTQYCTSRAFSTHYLELCDGYAALENSLRKILSKADLTNISHAQLCLYGPLRLVTFELQENYQQILGMNGKKTSRHITGADFLRLETPMKLSEYQCTIQLSTEVVNLKPFETVASGLGPWYLDGAHVLFPNRAHAARATLFNLITATAALRCLLYAQFGPESEAAISPTPSKGAGSGYYTAKSLFTLTPPQWEEDQCYQLDYVHSGPLPITPYPI